ncbi:hypothetical protein PPL_05150 [Heterostelium album PN500]|uniref:Uncharacterized protein n=1 Tax=Heterostelium pallidum (strain ATCC 26659 / Pp 5 / PN500) TaxID=670386 RepID=D3B9K6_HETP5|nr:hypothetical protein PPL_05150 [Heterostelium album PN500]EFA81918.1 hypothetical protein PPL_05150 [Heterostelium album PN500]|eukprot:XP_020434035.1 hypothetical protein PPL_05150 [Heterostelium album PN500]
MSSVLVLGSTGAIGFDIAAAFLNKGFKVYGLTRDQEKAKFLQKNEIIPIVGNAGDVNVWSPIAEKVDVVIEAVGDFTNPATSDSIFAKLKEISAKRKELTVIYTSGGMVYGEHDQELVFENSKKVVVNGLISGRVDIENQYLSIGAIVVQPSFVFGRKGSASGVYFDIATKHTGDVTIFGKATQYRSFVHSYDLAQLYLLIALRGQSLRGEVFIANSHYIRTEELIRDVARVANIPIKSVNYVSPPDDNPMAQILAVSLKLSSKKAQTILGWNPTQPSLSDDIERYYQAWKLSKEQQ